MLGIVKPPCEEASVLAAPEGPKQLPRRTWVLIVAILGSSMAFIDGTVVNLALPKIQTDLQATIAQAQWVVEAYTLFLAALIITSGSLGDHRGHRTNFSDHPIHPPAEMDCRRHREVRPCGHRKGKPRTDLHCRVKVTYQLD
jgi:hypothetical protein